MCSPNFYGKPDEEIDEAKAIEEDFMSVLLSPPTKDGNRQRIDATKGNVSPVLGDVRIESRQQVMEEAKSLTPNQFERLFVQVPDP